MFDGEFSGRKMIRIQRFNLLLNIIGLLFIIRAGGENIACSHSGFTNDPDVEIVPIVQPNPKNQDRLIVCSKNLKVLSEAPRPILLITVLDELMGQVEPPPEQPVTEAPAEDDYCSRWDEPCLTRDELPDVGQMLDEDDDEILAIPHRTAAAAQTYVTPNQESDDPCINVKNSYYLRIADKEKISGAWMLNKPIVVANCLNEKTSVFLIFLKDVCKEPSVVNSASVKLFTVAALLSSQLQYNSHGPVGVNTVHKLAKFTRSFHDMLGALKKKKLYGSNEMAKLRAPPFTWEFKGYNLEELSYTPKKTIRRIIRCQSSPTLIEIFPRVTVNHLASHSPSLSYDLAVSGRVKEVLNDTSAHLMRMAPLTLDGDRISGKKFTSFLEKLVQLVNNEKCRF